MGVTFMWSVQQQVQCLSSLRLRTFAAEMVDSDTKEKRMKCNIKGCAGEYESRLVVHTVRYHGEVIVIDHVPAEVCSVCGDVLFKPETIRRIEELLRRLERPARKVPLYEYA